MDCNKFDPYTNKNHLKGFEFKIQSVLFKTS